MFVYKTSLDVSWLSRTKAIAFPKRRLPKKAPSEEGRTTKRERPRLPTSRDHLELSKGVALATCTRANANLCCGGDPPQSETKYVWPLPCPCNHAPGGISRRSVDPTAKVANFT